MAGNAPGRKVQKPAILWGAVIHWPSIAAFLMAVLAIPTPNSNGHGPFDLRH